MKDINEIIDKFLEIVKKNNLNHTNTAIYDERDGYRITVDLRIFKEFKELSVLDTLGNLGVPFQTQKGIKE
jgi:hypothetical protein